MRYRQIRPSGGPISCLPQSPHHQQHPETAATNERDPAAVLQGQRSPDENEKRGRTETQTLVRQAAGHKCSDKSEETSTDQLNALRPVGDPTWRLHDAITADSYVLPENDAYLHRVPPPLQPTLRPNHVAIRVSVVLLRCAIRGQAVVLNNRPIDAQPLDRKFRSAVSCRKTCSKQAGAEHARASDLWTYVSYEPDTWPIPRARGSCRAEYAMDVTPGSRPTSRPEPKLTPRQANATAKGGDRHARMEPGSRRQAKPASVHRPVPVHQHRKDGRRREEDSSVLHRENKRIGGALPPNESNAPTETSRPRIPCLPIRLPTDGEHEVPRAGDVIVFYKWPGVRWAKPTPSTSHWSPTPLRPTLPALVVVAPLPSSSSFSLPP
nr:unnamed protein product [Digitaria exilis]